jgi:hypothetical protein
VGHGKWNTGSQGLHIGFRDNQLMCGFWGDDVHTSESYTDTEWHHWAITYDTSTKQQYIYRDGIIAGKRKAKAHYSGAGPLYIGCMSGNTWFYNGQIDEVRVWNTTRTATEINSYRYLPVKGNEPDLLGYWQFNERSGDTLADISANHFTGIRSGFSVHSWIESEAWKRRKTDTSNDTIIIFGGYSKYAHPVDIRIIRQPSFGKADIDALTSTISYTSNQTLSAVDTISFEVKDDSLSSVYEVLIYSQYPESVNPEQKSYSVTVYPNPSNSIAYILLDGTYNGKVMLSVFDLKGNLLLSKEEMIQQNNKLPIELNLSAFRQGTYILKISNDSENQVVRLVKVR